MDDKNIKSLQHKRLSNLDKIGISSLSELPELIKRYQEINSIPSGLRGITDFARTISNQMRPINSLTSLSSSVYSQFASQNLMKSNTILNSLSSSLLEISKQNQYLSERLTGFATSQLLLTNSLTDFAKSFKYHQLQKFNSIDIAIQELSKSYLKDIYKTGNWEDIEIASSANNVIYSNVIETIKPNEQITLQDFEDFKFSIINELQGLFSKTKSENAKQFVLELITLIGFLLTFYSVYLSKTDISNKDVVIETRKEIEKVSKVLCDKIELKKLNRTRIATTSVNLRYSPKKNSKIIGLVKKEQQVTVLEIHHKYLLISYIDFETLEPKSGFVMKKYFIREE